MGDERDPGATETAAPSGAEPTVPARPGAGSHDDATVDARAVGARPSAPRFEMIGRFAIERTLGEGGMGVVMLAHDATLDRRVAIKLLRTRDDGVGSTGRVRLLREAQAMARLRHANVVTVFEAGVHDASVYIVMEYIAGGTLRGWLRAHATAAWRDVLARFVQAGHGLAAAHRSGVVHRDFKPDNVLVDDSGEVKVTDFGLAARDESLDGEPARDAAAPRPDLDALSHTLTQAGDVMGTPKYMSPEQHEARPTTPHTDQFSFCVALYEALYGQHPFSDGDYAALRAATLAAVVRPPAGDRGVPAAIHAALLRGLARAPDARHASMDALLAALAVAGDARPPRAWAARNAGWLGAVGGVSVAVAAFAFVALSHDAPEEPTPPPPPALPTPGLAAPASAQDLPDPGCDCELLFAIAPPDGTVAGASRGSDDAGIRALGSNAFAITAGPAKIDYDVGHGHYHFAVVSHGHGYRRTVKLPEPELRDGYTFVPGGEVTIGRGNGAADERPAATVTLAAYLIETAPFFDGADATYERALSIAAEEHARLPTAAEWEWAARSGVISSRKDGWEWTATAYVPYPYGDDGRDDELAERARSEVRGGSDTPEARGEGRHTGRAELRLASTPSYAPREPDVTARLRDEPTPGDPRAQRRALSEGDLARFDRFLVAWVMRPDAPALRVTGAWCGLDALLARAGVPANRREYVAGATPDVVALALAPDPHYRAPADAPRRTCAEDTVTRLGPVCFEGEKLSVESLATVAAIASTLLRSPKLHVEVAAHVTTDALAATQGLARAKAVRAALLEAGVAPGRITARGAGPRPVNAGLFDDTPDEQCAGASPREGVDVLVTAR